MPQWEAWSEFVTDCEAPLSNMDANLKYWTEQAEKEKANGPEKNDGDDDDEEEEKPEGEERRSSAAVLTGDDAEVLVEALSPRRTAGQNFTFIDPGAQNSTV